LSAYIGRSRCAAGATLSARVGDGKGRAGQRQGPRRATARAAAR